MLPELNKIYNYFDDGKIRESRRIPVIITEIIPFDKIDDKILEQWKEEVIEIDWIYAKETDYFIKGKLLDEDLEKDNQSEVIFVKTIRNDFEWFSLGWWGGILDIDGQVH